MAIEALSTRQIEDVIEQTTGYGARDADIQVVQMLGGTSEQLAEYVWDHLLGEPEHPDLELVEREVRRIVGAS